MTENVLSLRAHHLLCTVLYKGKGYSSLFNENMNAVVSRLREGCDVRLCSSPDAICAGCPNRRENGGCALDEENKLPGEEIKTLDSRILERFGLDRKTVYDSGYLFGMIRDNITEEDFDKCCSDCRWRKKGLCSYTEYIKRIENFIKE